MMGFSENVCFQKTPCESTSLGGFMLLAIISFWIQTALKSKMYPSLEPHSPGGPSKELQLAPAGHSPQARYFLQESRPSFPTNYMVGKIISIFRKKCSAMLLDAWLISVEHRHKPGCARSLPVNLTRSQLCKSGQIGGPAATGSGGLLLIHPLE